MKTARYLIVLLLEVVMISSCTGFLNIIPEDKIEAEKLFSQPEGYWYALNGVYYKMIQEELYRPVSNSLTAHTLENLIETWSPSKLSVQGKLSKHTYKTSDVDALLGKYFLSYYNLICNLNRILDYIEAKDVLKGNEKNLIKGETLGLRCFLQFDLIRIFGPIPTKIEGGKKYLPYPIKATDKPHLYLGFEEYMNALARDLDEAIFLTQNSDPITKYSLEQLNQPGSIDEIKEIEYYNRNCKLNHYALIALRARVALWKGDRENARKFAMKLIPLQGDAIECIKPEWKLGTTQSLGNVNNTERNNNTLKEEILFGLDLPLFNYENHWESELEGRIFMNKEKVDALYPNKEDKDFRKLLFSSIGNTIYASSNKFWNNQNLQVPLIRLAELYLIMAETSSIREANIYYKAFCESRSKAYQKLTEENRVDILLQEYRKEFIGEGQTFFANKRCGITRPYDCKETYGIAQYVLPIPTRENNI